MNIGFAAYAHRLFREGVTGLNKRSQEFFLAVFLLFVALSTHVQETFNRAPFQTLLGRFALAPYQVGGQHRGAAGQRPGHDVRVVELGDARQAGETGRPDYARRCDW